MNRPYSDVVKNLWKREREKERDRQRKKNPGENEASGELM